MAAEADQVNYVYVARRSADGLYKIGYSCNPAVRIRTLGKVADGIRFVGMFPSANPFVVEQYLHVVFRHRRVAGEWFRLSSRMAARVARLGRCDAPADLPDSFRRMHAVCSRLPNRYWGPSITQDDFYKRVLIDSEVLPIAKAAAYLTGRTVEEFISDALNAVASEVIGRPPIVRRPAPPKPHGKGRPKKS